MLTRRNLSADACRRWSATTSRVRSLVHAVRQKREPKAESIFTDDQTYEARSLLRSILREATYLPDSEARRYIRAYAVARFRDYRHGSKPSDVLRSRRDAKIKEARKGLSVLQRAAAGHFKCFQKVLLLAYGRTGRRRHELMRPLLEVSDEVSTARSTAREASATPVDDEGPSTASEKSFDVTSVLDKLPRLNGKLRTLLMSQMNEASPDVTRKNPKHIYQFQPQIPEMNAWKRPMPISRQVNMTKTWYARTLDRVSPPLPKEDWHRLKRLALDGPSPEDRQVARRKPAIVLKGPLQSGSSRPVTSAAQVPLSALGIELTRPGKRITRSIAPRKLSDRQLRRLFTWIYAQCPLMHWMSEQGHWKIEWGHRAIQQAVRRSSVIKG